MRKHDPAPTSPAEREVLRGFLQQRIEDGERLLTSVEDRENGEAWYQRSLNDLQRVGGHWASAFAGAGYNVRRVMRDQTRELFDADYKAMVDAADGQSRIRARIPILREAKADLDSQDLLEQARTGAAALRASGLGPEAFAFMKNADLKAIAARDYEELRATPTSSAKSRLILAGSVIEATLMEALEQKGIPRQVTDRMDLHGLIKEAMAQTVIRPQTEQAAHAVRKDRNLVHPAVEIRDGRIKLEDSDLAVAAMRSVLAELR